MDINIGVLIVGIIFVAAGILILVKQLKSKKNNTASAFAEVTRYDTEISHDSDHESTVYYPVMRYYAAGQWFEKRSDVGRGKEKYAIGERVEVLYDPNRPENFIIAGDNTALIMSIIAMLMGIGVCILSFFAE